MAAYTTEPTAKGVSCASPLESFDILIDKKAGIRSSFSEKVGWNAGFDPISARFVKVAGGAML